MSRKQPLDFRQADVAYIMQQWRAAQSCSLIGTGSIGKTNLIQHLSDPLVQTHFMPTTSDTTFRAILIDPNLLSPLPDPLPENASFRSWAGCELLMHRLFMSFYPFTILEEDRDGFYQTYAELQDGTNPLYSYNAIRYLELGFEYFFTRNVKLVLMFDEFEEMLRLLPPVFFSNLRAIRDNYKNQLLFMTFSRAPLDMLTEQLGIENEEISPFLELFTDHVHFVGPYSMIDAERMLETLVNRSGLHYDPSVTRALQHATGRFAGLMRAGFRALENMGASTSPSANLVDMLLAQESFCHECHTLWMSLTTGEREVIRYLLFQKKLTISQEMLKTTLYLLMQKKLLFQDETHNRLEISPPVFKGFVERYLS